MEDLVEGAVSNHLRTGEVHQGKSEPFADNRDVTRPKDRQRECFHEPDILCQKFGIVVGAGSIRTGNQNHLWLLGAGVNHASWYQVMFDFFTLREKPANGAAELSPAAFRAHGAAGPPTRTRELSDAPRSSANQREDVALDLMRNPP